MKKSTLITTCLSIIVWTIITIYLAVKKVPVYLTILAGTVILFNIVSLIINLKANKNLWNIHKFIFLKREDIYLINRNSL